MTNSINQKIEELNRIKFNRTPIEKKEFYYSDGTRDDYKITEMVNFIHWHKNITKFVDWTKNTIYLRTDIEQPLYITDPDNYAKTLDDRFPLTILSED